MATPLFITGLGVLEIRPFKYALETSETDGSQLAQLSTVPAGELVLRPVMLCDGDRGGKEAGSGSVIQPSSGLRQHRGQNPRSKALYVWTDPQRMARWTSTCVQIAASTIL